MGLTNALQIGRSALLASQAALEVAGNNLANVASAGYHRQRVDLAPTSSQRIGPNLFIGRGVQIQEIARQVDSALEGRVRGGISDQAATIARRNILSQIEALQGELSDIDLSSHLGAFFNAFSDLANRPLDNSLRTLAAQQGRTLASFTRNMRTDLSGLRVQVDDAIGDAVLAANDLLTQIDRINDEVVASEGGLGTGAPALRDQRAQLLEQLSEYMDISTNELTSGAVDVFVGSLPIVLNGDSRGIELRTRTIEGELQVDVIVSADGSVLRPRSGRIGALVEARETDVNAAIETLDNFANQLIYQVNRLHSQGQGTKGFTTITGTNRVLDPTVALGDEAAGLDFTPAHGSFQIHLTQKSTGQRVTSQIDIDLDGINAAGDTTLNSLVAGLNAVANVTASITSDGRLKLDSASNDFEISFSDDSSGVLATLGLNTYFTGGDALDIDVNNLVAQTPGLIAAGLGHVPGDNRNAVAIAGLREQQLDALGGLSLTDVWRQHVEDYAIRLGQSEQQVEADTVVLENLQAQQAQVSGVNTDEEAIDLLAFQRAYQGSARFLTAVDELMQTILAMV